MTWLKISFIACHLLMQVHQLQQKQQLTVLREKAKIEVEESQRFLTDLLQHNLEVSYFRSCATAAGFNKMFLQTPLFFFSHSESLNQKEFFNR